MKLADLAKAKSKIPIHNLGSDTPLAKEVQSRLAKLGCLDPPADGQFGPVSMLALAGFAKQCKLPFDNKVLTGKIADALLSQTPATFMPLKLGNDFASRIVKYMQAKNYFVARLPAFHNIVYVEGCDADGRKNADEFDKWNDRRIVFAISGTFRPVILLNALATSEPGRFFTEHPINKLGTARIALDQFKAWRVGMHHPNNQPPSRHEALVQAGTISVFRDTDKNGLRTGDPESTGSGMFLNQHSGHNQNPTSIGMSSAGCMVGRSDDKHRTFMNLNKKDARYIANHGYMFMTAVIPGDDLQKRFPIH